MTQSINDDSLNSASTLALTKALIARQSVTPNDAGCQPLIANFLAQSGFSTEAMNFEDTQNIWSTRGSGSPCLVFAGHTDVVPAGNLAQWHTPPFEPCEKEGMLIGRGAADMKGSLAAMLTATRRFVNDYPTHRGSIGYLITSDEEGPFINGTVKVVEALQKRQQIIDYCIVGEPSSNQQLGDVIKIGRRGSLTAWVTIKGIQGHVAYPHLANNAIHQTSIILNHLTNISWDNGNQFFPPTSFQVTNIAAGEATNIIPGECQVEFNFRYSTEQTVNNLQTKIEQILAEHGVEFDIKWKLNGEPFITQSRELIDAVSRSIKQVCQLDCRAETSGGTSDGRFIAKTGAQIVELGPINKTIHQANESVNIEDLDTLSEIYYQIMVYLLA